MSYDNRASTAGYLPQHVEVTTTGYVHCRENDLYPAEIYPGTSTGPHVVDVMVNEEPHSFSAMKGEDKTELITVAGEKPNDYIELTLVACFFNFIFALVAMSWSYRSQEHWKAGRGQSAKWYGIASMAISVFAIVSTAIVVFALVWLFV